MTQYPNYGTASYPAQTYPRPTSVTVLAIVGIIWGVLGLLCNGFGLLPLLVPNLGGPNPAMDAIRADPVANTWAIVGPILGLALSILLIAGCAAALGLKAWGRGALLVYAVLQTVLALLNAAITVAVINPLMSKALQGQMPAESAGIVAAVQQGSVVVGILIALIVLAWILLVMFRANVKAAFGMGGANAMPPAGAPPQYPAGQYPPQGPYGQQ